MIEFEYHYFGSPSVRTGLGKGHMYMLNPLGECLLENCIFTWCQRMNLRLLTNCKGGGEYILTWKDLVIGIFTE